MLKKLVNYELFSNMEKKVFIGQPKPTVLKIIHFDPNSFSLVTQPIDPPTLPL